jgi:serpin B
MPFSDGADFSDMGETGTGSLYISRVFHKTHIELDRFGTKAAAATAVEMDCEGAIMIDDVKEVKLDRPFVYAIIDTESGTPVFMGAVNTVNG